MLDGQSQARGFLFSEERHLNIQSDQKERKKEVKRKTKQDLIKVK